MLELLKDKSLSIELFPPKTGVFSPSLENKAWLTKIDKEVHPSWVSLTCHTTDFLGHLTRAQEIRKYVSQPLVAHLTCVGRTQADIYRMVALYLSAGIKDFLALRGDNPASNAGCPVADVLKDFKYASDLVTFLRQEFGNEISIGVAAYPQAHPESLCLYDDIEMVKLKVDCGADYIVTQLAFDNERFFEWYSMAVNADIRVPIVAGVMPIISQHSITKMCRTSKVTLSNNLIRLMGAYKDPNQFFQAGMLATANQIVDLQAFGVKNIHVYSLNRLDVIRHLQGFCCPIFS